MLPEDKTNAPKIPSKRQNAILTDLADYLISAKGYSLNTIRSYQNDLIQFFRFLRRRFGQVDRDCPFEAIDISPIDFSLLSAVQLADIYAFLGYASVQRDMLIRRYTRCAILKDGTYLPSQRDRKSVV